MRHSVKLYGKGGAGVVALFYMIKFLAPVIKAYHAHEPTEFLQFLAVWTLFLVAAAGLGYIAGLVVGAMIEGMTLPGVIIIGGVLWVIFDRGHVRTVVNIAMLILVARYLPYWINKGWHELMSAFHARNRSRPRTTPAAAPTHSP